MTYILRFVKISLLLALLLSLGACSSSGSGSSAVGRHYSLQRSITSIGAQSITSDNLTAKAGESLVLTYKATVKKGSAELTVFRKAQLNNPLKSISRFTLDQPKGTKTMRLPTDGTYYFVIYLTNFDGSFEIEANVK